MKKTVNKLAKQKYPKRFWKFFLVLAIFILVLFGLFLIFRFTGLWEKVNSIEKIRYIVEKGGVYSALVFVLIQVLQTTILQIPSMITTIAGMLIFGTWKTFFLSYFAVMLGSIIMFWIGRRAGRKFLYWLVGEDTAEKWIDKMSHGKYLYFLMMLFPCFPDDILCVVAGVTNMTFPYFFWTNILARGISIATIVFFGSGSIIPFHGWGLAVWGGIVILVAVLFYLSIRYKDKLDVLMKQLFGAKKRNK